MKVARSYHPRRFDVGAGRDDVDTLAVIRVGRPVVVFVARRHHERTT